jgi:spore germination protein KB
MSKGAEPTPIHEVEQGLIQGHQLMAMLFLARMVPITVTFPAITGIPIPQDGWIAVLLSVLATIPVALWIVWLGLSFPGKTIVEYSEILFGKVVGKLLGLGLILFFLGKAATTARAIGEAYAVAIMPETPIVIVMAVMVFLGANAAHGGLEVVGRMAESVFWMVLFFALLVLVLPANAMKVENLRPVLPGGLGAAVGEAGTSWIIFLETIVVGMIMPFLTCPSDARRFSLYAVGAAGLVGVGFAAVLVAVFGVLAPSLTLPAFSLGRMISVGGFLERVEVIPMGVWTVSAGIKIACFIWASAVGLAQVFGLQRYQPLVYPLGVLTVSLGLSLFKNITDVEMMVDPRGSGVCIIVALVSYMTILSLARLLRGHRAEANGR